MWGTGNPFADEPGIGRGGPSGSMFSSGNPFDEEQQVEERRSLIEAEQAQERWVP